MPQPAFRFAPSPNGELHLGHAYSALLGHALAKAFGGRFLLRMEDIDLARCRPHYEAQMLDDLAWLGLEWEQPVRRQSEHFATYAQALARLESLGVVYRCYASRAEISRAAQREGSGCDPDGAPLPPGRDRVLPREEHERRARAGAPFAVRLDMAKARALVGSDALTFIEFDGEGGERTTSARPERWGDVVIARKEAPASYHLAVVVDDALQGITHVTRGLDLHAATDIHRLLQALLDLPVPRYHHHRLITDASGRKLSKRHRDRSLRSLRAQGLSAAEVRAMLGF